MSELLTQPMITGSGMTYIGLAPGVLYSMAPAGGHKKRSIETDFCSASAVISVPNIRINAEESGG